MNSGNYIILKTQVFKESDIIVHALNVHGGREHFLARSALKSKKRFGGGILEAMNYVQLNYDDRKQKAQFVPLTEAKLLKGFEGVRKDYDRLQVGLNFVQDVFKVTREGDDFNDDIFNLLGNALKALEVTSDLRLLELHFRIKLLSYAGFLPNEEGEFNAFINEPVTDHVRLKNHYKLSLKSLSDRVFKELTQY